MRAASATNPTSTANHSVAKRTSNGKRFTVRPLPLVIPKTTDVLNAATVAGATTSDGSTYSFANTSQTSGLKRGDVMELDAGILGSQRQKVV